MFRNISISSKNFTLVFAALAGILVISAFGLFELRDISIRDSKTRIRSVVEAVHGMASTFAVQSGESPRLLDADAKRLVVEALSETEFGNGVYFWVQDAEGRLVVHRDPNVPSGQDFPELIEPGGEKIRSQIEETARRSGAGFVTYTWSMSGYEVPVPKISYVKSLAPWGWILGAGVYADGNDQWFLRQAGVFGITVVGVFLVIAGISWLVTFNIVRPLKTITWGMKQLSRGDTAVSAGDIERRDELGDLARAMDVFKRNLQEINRLRIERGRLKAKENEVLRESEERFRDFAEASSDWFWETDNQDRFTFVSGRVSELLGFQPEDLIGKTRSELGITRQGKRPSGGPRSGEARKAFRDVEYLARDREGKPRTIRISGKPHYDRNGLFQGYRGTGSDVTAEVEAARREAQAHKRMMTAIAKIPIGVALFDRSDRLVVCNERYRFVNPLVDDLPPNTTFEEIVRENVRHGFVPVEPGKEEEAVQERLARHRNPGEPFETVRRDRWITIHEFRTEEGDTLLITVDITDRKEAEQSLRESEEKFRALFENANDSIFLSDPQTGCILDANENGVSRLGFQRHEIMALALSDVLEIPPSDGRPSDADKGGFCSAEMVETWQVRKDGLKMPVEVNARLVSIGNHAVVQSIVRDITQRKVMQKQLVDAQKMKAVGELTGGVAHDFNNLLTVVIGSLEWLLDLPNTNEQARRLIFSALEAAQRGAELTRNLLAYARRQMLTPKVLSVEDTIGRIESLIARVLPESIETEVDVIDDLWPIRVDPALLEDAIVNLALNARDAISESGRFTIVGRNVSHADAAKKWNDGAVDGEFVELAFRDDGAGMSLDVAEKACDPFFTTKDIGQGRGLGLSMVKGFVEQSGGRLVMTTKQGKGTTVSLFFPRAG